MAELLDDLAAHLVTQGVGTLWNGTTGNIWKGILPEANVTGTLDTIALIEEHGVMPIETMGNDTQPVIERPRIMVYSRSGSEFRYDLSKALARTVWRALTLISNETVNGTYYQRVWAGTSPFLWDRDESNLVVIAQPFDIMRAVTP